MKNILSVIICILCMCAFLKACDYGLEKEQRRQCIVAMDTCEKYPDACKPEYFKVCEGVEDVD